jgi:glycerol kinase
MNCGEKVTLSKNSLLTTVAWEREKRRGFAIEGSIFIAGALIQWLQEGLGVIREAAEAETLAASVEDSRGCVVVPAFVGLGAPHWDEGARGAVFGLTRDTRPAHIVLAALEGVAHQVADLLDLSEFANIKYMSIDGGMSRNRLFCQILADLCSTEVHVPESSELTARGVAYLALGRAASIGERSRIFKPKMDNGRREKARALWRSALSRTLSERGGRV